MAAALAAIAGIIAGVLATLLSIRHLPRHAREIVWCPNCGEPHGAMCYMHRAEKRAASQ